jgi:hypothetical protein
VSASGLEDDDGIKRVDHDFSRQDFPLFK